MEKENKTPKTKNVVKPSSDEFWPAVVEAAEDKLSHERTSPSVLTERNSSLAVVLPGGQ